MPIKTSHIRPTQHRLEYCSFVALLLAVSCFYHSPSTANYIELSATTNYRKSSIDRENFQESVSYTGSISYYFWEMSALELSYTNGLTELNIKPPGEPKTTNTTVFQLIGLDLVISFAGREDFFQPYVKAGGAYLEKKATQEVEGFGVRRIPSVHGIVPSGGLGFRLKLNQQFSFRAGIDAWTSPMDQKVKTVDYAGRAGISWFF